AEAVERAVTAEADKAELAFKLDEVRGALAVAERSADQRLEELSRLEAALRGTVRGLNARLAEVTELYQLAQARLALSEDDRRGLEATNHELTRELAEAREQLELEMARARVTAEARPTMPAPADDEELRRLRAVEGTAAQREGELLGALMQCREEGAELALRTRQASMEAELAREALAEVEERVEGMRFGYESRLAELVDELEGVGSDAERALIQVGELRTRLEVRERTEAALRGELAGVRMRLADREAAVKALREAQASDAGASSAAVELPGAPGEAAGATQAGAVPAPAEGPEGVTQAGPPEAGRVVIAGRRSVADEPALEAESEEAEAVRAALVEARAEAEGLRARVEELSRAPAPEPTGGDGALEAELRAAVGARDAMIGRLQAELAHAADRRRELDRRLAKCAGELEGKRRALAEAREAGDADGDAAARLEELTARVEASERERAQAQAALSEARQILHGLERELPRIGDDEGYEEPGYDGVEVRRLRDRLSKLDAEAADREVLLRSLTAQVQERDDRIRALERLQQGDGGDEDPAALRARLLEMEERVARLSEELEHERDARRRLEDRA
ncbi:MAG TPA: hypothetical protein RMH99_13380, partial [Sandaracinaceae bacterium LLY-WYZ-13_1]|nr:hypothetical protein [Sandaracinaceae bacterium LLY-WYZ-13_1]